MRVGARLPAYCSATGRVLLSQLANDKLRATIGKKALPSRTVKTVVKPTGVFQKICQVREKGYSENDEELELGLRSLAVPVRDTNGTIVSAMSVSAYAARVSRSVLLKQFLPVLRECAVQLETQCFGRTSNLRLSPETASA